MSLLNWGEPVRRFLVEICALVSIAIAISIGCVMSNAYANSNRSIQDANRIIDSLCAASERQSDSLAVLSESIDRMSGIGDPFNSAKLLVAIFSILMGVCAVIMAFITYMSKRQFDESKEAIKEAKNQLGILREQLKRVIVESRDYLDYFMILFNDSLPEAMKLRPQDMKYILDLASLDLRVRFAAISALRATKNKAIIPYLEWVIVNRPDSKDEAKDAIIDISGSET
jgi:hypothetical protein